MYKSILKPLLFQLNPDNIHERFTALGERLGDLRVSRELLSLVYGYRGPDISKTVDGIRYRTPVLLSAGFDYNARLTRILPSLSFGGVEVGSVSARPCQGNPKPRLTRLVKSKSILVNKGLRNQGVEAIIDRLKSKQRVPEFVVGVSIARTNDERSSSDEEGIKDYCFSLAKLVASGIGDYYTINISCPNAFCGETFTKPELLNKLLASLKQISCSKPVYIKMPISIAGEQFDELLEIIVKHNLNGVIVGNLNKNYSELEHPEEAPQKYSGGLSGKPCRVRSNDLLARTKEKYGDKLIVIGCGGIFSPQDALEKFRRGADLVQLITGMIFEGPGLIKNICKAYAASFKTD